MALIEDDVPIVLDGLVHLTSMDQTLQDGDIHQSRGMLLAGSNLPDRTRGWLEKLLQTTDPLIHQLSGMYQHQRVRLPARDQPGPNHGFAEGSRGYEYSCFMLE